MARHFAELRQAMSGDRKERNAERAAVVLATMDLGELRGAMEVTQEELAGRLAVAQSNVSRLERRPDMLVSTLRDVVAALGGELRVLAVFPDGTVEVVPFDETAV